MNWERMVSLVLNKFKRVSGNLKLVSRRLNMDRKIFKVLINPWEVLVKSRKDLKTLKGLLKCQHVLKKSSSPKENICIHYSFFGKESLRYVTILLFNFQRGEWGMNYDFNISVGHNTGNFKNLWDVISKNGNDVPFLEREGRWSWFQNHLTKKKSYF